MNDLSKFENGTNKLVEGALTHGLSDLHLKLHCFDFLLKLSYKSVLPEDKHQVRGKENQDLVADRKLVIQQRFKEQMNMLVDMPKPSGGNTNTGNVARRAFEDARVLSEILNLDFELINNIRILLIAISVKHQINVTKFQKVIDRSLQIYKEKYEKFPLPPTVHKLFFHAAAVIENSPVPVCYLSEEAAETKIKYIRYFREHFSRKDSLEHTLVDIYNRSMDMSDPKIASMIREQQPKKRSKEIPQEVKELLVLHDSEEMHAEYEEEGGLQDSEDRIVEE